MRDAHLLKEKVQLSLDNRQIASLVVGGLAILGFVFGLGVVVGRKMAPPPVLAEAGPADLLAEVDKKSDFDPAKELTYHEALTAPAVHATVVDKVEEPAPAPKPLPKIEPPQVADAESEQAQLPRKAETPAPPAADVYAEEPQDAKPAAASTNIVSAFDHVHTQTTAGEFTIQVSASQERTEAETVVGKLKASGYSPYVVDAQIPGKGRWYRVRLGHFGTKTDAERYLRDFKRETQLNAIVTAAR
jgi:DedD protein